MAAPLMRRLVHSSQTLSIARLFAHSAAAQKLESKVTEVCTTGYAFKTASGRMAKYGVFWGHNDPRNTICEIPGATHVAAMITALIDAVRVARKCDPSSKLLIYTDFNCPSNFQQKLESYAKRDFYSFKGPKMKNAELLKELYECSKDVEVTFKHRPAVENKMPNYVMANILKGEKFAITSYPSSSGSDSIEELLGSGSEPTTSTKEWPRVFAAAMFQTGKNGFKAASYATVWADKRYGNDTMHRLAMHPVTLFRAQLSAIEDALSQAVDNQLPKVLLVTDSRAFMLNWRKGWIKPNGSPAPNKFLYDRIKDLTQAGTEVCFRYEPQQKDSPEWSQAVEKCLEAIDLPMIGKDRSEYGRSVSDLLSDEPSLQNSCIPKVRIFKKGTNLPNGVVWNTENDQKIDDAKELDARIHRALLRVLEKASSMEMRELIIRTDSSRLISSTENWLPIWHRNGWRNSLHKHIADADSWKRIWQLKKTIKVYWELMDPPDDGDKAASQLISLSSSSKTG